MITSDILNSVSSSTTLMYEAHITIEPVVGDRYDLFSSICEQFNFKPAKLVMIKDREITDIRSNKDSFCTGHSKNLLDIRSRINFLVDKLNETGYNIWRVKIEAIVLDTRYQSGL
jgi:hypothetical protein